MSQFAVVAVPKAVVPLASAFLPLPGGGWMGQEHTFFLYDTSGEACVNVDFGLVSLHHFDSKDAARAWCERKEALVP